MNIDPEGTSIGRTIETFISIWTGVQIGPVATGIVTLVKFGHYNRNIFNTDLPSKPDNADSMGWKIGDPRYHRFSDSKNIKWVSSDGHKEIIFDSAGNIVDNPRDIGSYNFIPNGVNQVGHGIVDVLPWILWGNNSKDSTTIFDRFFLWLGL